MKTAALCLVASLAVGGSAFATERAPASPAHCLTIDKMKAAFGKEAKLTALDAGQFHLAEGAYLVIPPSNGLPHADGAFIASMKAASLIIWMSGKCRSETEPTLVGPDFAEALMGVSSGAGEKIEPDDSKGEIHL